MDPYRRYKHPAAEEIDDKVEELERRQSHLRMRQAGQGRSLRDEAGLTLNELSDAIELRQYEAAYELAQQLLPQAKQVAQGLLGSDFGRFRIWEIERRRSVPKERRHEIVFVPGMGPSYGYELGWVVKTRVSFFGTYRNSDLLDKAVFYNPRKEGFTVPSADWAWGMWKHDSWDGSGFVIQSGVDLA